MKVSKYIIPLLVILTIVGGYNLRHAFTMPSTSVVYVEGDGTTINCTVDGISCRGTAGYFTSLFDSTNGIMSIDTYASEHQAVIKYDPDLITQDSIVAVMEQLIPLNDGTEAQIFDCLEIK